LGAIALYLAAIRIGAVYVPLNTAYTESEVRAFLDDAEPRLFVASSLRPGVAGCEAAVLGTTPASPLWAEALAAGPAVAVEPRSGSDLAAIVDSSATTGRPKGAMLSHGYHAAHAATGTRHCA